MPHDFKKEPRSWIIETQGHRDKNLMPIHQSPDQTMSKRGLIEEE